MPGGRIAIIGGGMTGLALAYFLGRAGWRTTIFEKGPILSGLLVFTEVTGIPIERFYHHFFTHDHYLLELLEELGLDDAVMWQPSQSAVYADGALAPFVTKLDYLRLPFLNPATKLRAGLATLRMHRHLAVDLPPDLTAEQYLRELFGDQGWQKMWRPLLVNKFGEELSHRISAQWVAKRLEIRTKSERSGREVLGYIKGSYQVLAEKLRDAIVAQGGQIALNAEIQNLVRAPGGGLAINGEDYDLVVSTVAPDIIKKIVPDLHQPAVAYRAAVCPMFILRSSITPYYWINILDLKLPFSVIVNQQALLPPGYYGGKWPLYVGNYLDETSNLFTKSDQELADYYLGHLRQIWPTIDHEVVDYKIGRTKYAQPVVTAPWTPLKHTTNIPNLYTTSMAHIFPEDRGVNYSIREAKRILALLETAGTKTSATPGKLG